MIKYQNKMCFESTLQENLHSLPGTPEEVKRISSPSLPSDPILFILISLLYTYTTSVELGRQSTY